MTFSGVFGFMKWHLLLCAAVFYILPLACFIVPPEMLGIIFFIITSANAFVILGTCISLTIKHGFVWYYPIVMMFIYAPTLVMYYEASMLGNLILYLVLGYSCQIMGLIIRKIIERNKQY